MKDSEHARKVREAGIKKHGSEAAWREYMRQASNKSSRNSKGTGGFRYLKEHNPEKLKEIAVMGGKTGKRNKE